ncbi:hypothetical protein [Priestia aryabhattai]|uniref:hypothetical protein n=1 Tax=Priestia aryabhattai TaxID=412384 RepID=UPI0030D5F67B
MSVIALLIVVINCVVVCLNYKKAIWLNLFLILATPLGALTPSINTIFLLRIGPFSAYEINIIVILIMSLIKSRFKIYRFYILPALLMCFYLINILSSSPLYGLNSVLADAKDYIISLIIIFIVSQITDEDSLKRFLNIALKAVFCSSIIIFLFYIISQGTIFPTPIRYGFSIQSLYVFSIPYIIYIYGIGMCRKKWLLFSLFLQIYLMVIAQNRTNILLIISILAIMFIYYIFVSKNMRNAIKKRLSFFGVLFLIAIIIMSIDIYQNRTITTGFYGRINEMIFSDFSTDSTEVRSITMDYYIEEIKKNIWGYGLGKYMPALSIYNSGFESTTLLNYGFDNMFITMSYKVGVIAAIIYLIFFVVQLFKFYLTRRKYSDNMLYLIILIGLYVSCAVLTGQLLKNIGIYTFVLTLIVHINNRNIKQYERVRK